MTEPQKINIVVDNKATEKLAEILEKERLEKKFDLAEKKQQLYDEIGDSRFLTAQSKEELMAITNELMTETARRLKGTPAGSAYANDAQYGRSNDLYKRKFNSDKEMVDAILEDMHGSDAKKAEIARSYYDGLLGKWIMAKRNKQGLDEFFNPNAIENLPPLTKTPEGFMVPQNKSEGDIGKILRNWKLERDRKAKEGVEQ